MVNPELTERLVPEAKLHLDSLISFYKATLTDNTNSTNSLMPALGHALNEIININSEAIDCISLIHTHIFLQCKNTYFRTQEQDYNSGDPHYTSEEFGKCAANDISFLALSSFRMGYCEGMKATSSNPCERFFTSAAEYADFFKRAFQLTLECVNSGDEMNEETINTIGLLENIANDTTNRGYYSTVISPIVRAFGNSAMYLYMISENPEPNDPESNYIAQNFQNLARHVFAIGYKQGKAHHAEIEILDNMQRQT